ncbi:anti-repressor SinI family protein [Bacillus sinesaloumensis]|nr:anti-repressor SinI family protein [Bacillus sinesaloumensis]
MEGLDQDWVKLISEAKELGLSIQDVEEFLLNHIKQTAKEISFK